MREAAEALIPCYLELGGNDPMIVCADADVERAANAAAFWSMNNAGQVCISVERAYVEAPVYDEFVAPRDRHRRATLRQGPPTGEGTVDVGAVIFPPQIDIVEAHVNDAVAEGREGPRRRPPAPGRRALLRADRARRRRPLDGRACARRRSVRRSRSCASTTSRRRSASPTIPSTGCRRASGPATSTRGEQIARRVHAGAVCVNDAQINYSALNLPMGGWKSSGIGTRHGAAGIRKYCRTQSLLITRRGFKRDPFMFPYVARRTRLLRGRVPVDVRSRRAALSARLTFREPP